MTIDDIAKLLDEKLKGVVGDMEVVRARLANMERKMPQQIEYLRILKELSKLEEGYIGIQGKLEKMATKEDLARIEKELGLARKNIDSLTEMFQDMADAIVIRKEFVGLEKRVEGVEGHLELAV